MKFVVLVVAFAIVLMTPSRSLARYVQTAKVRYDTRVGTSDWYKVDVNFVTGGELNTATNSIRYQSWSSYAVIFWAQGQASVIKLKNIYGCSSEFSEACLPILGKMRGEDQEDREWEICTGIYC